MTEAYIIPALRMPSEEELRLSAQRWFEPLEPCLYENWPSELQSLSFETVSIPLNGIDISALLDTFDDRYDEQTLGQLSNRIDAAASALAVTGFYPRLNSRSPKDSFHAFGKLADFRCFNGNDVISLFSGSERILDDLARWRRLSGCSILLREFKTIPAQEEWRCFIRHGRVVGISQYFYQEHFPEIASNGDRMRHKILRFLETKIMPNLHLDTVVVDVWLREEPLLIEINPYGLSDPCLLSYSELERHEVPIFRVVEASPPSEAA